MRAVALTATAVVVVLALCAAYPPEWSPGSWRRLTRRFRHRVRPRYYRHTPPWQKIRPEDRVEPGYDWDRGTTPDP